MAPGETETLPHTWEDHQIIIDRILESIRLLQTMGLAGHLSQYCFLRGKEVPRGRLYVMCNGENEVQRVKSLLLHVPQLERDSGDPTCGVSRFRVA